MHLDLVRQERARRVGDDADVDRFRDLPGFDGLWCRGVSSAYPAELGKARRGEGGRTRPIPLERIIM